MNVRFDDGFDGAFAVSFVPKEKKKETKAIRKRYSKFIQSKRTTTTNETKYKFFFLQMYCIRSTFWTFVVCRFFYSLTRSLHIQQMWFVVVASNFIIHFLFQYSSHKNTRTKYAFAIKYFRLFFLFLFFFFIFTCFSLSTCLFCSFSFLLFEYYYVFVVRHVRKEKSKCQNGWASEILRFFFSSFSSFVRSQNVFKCLIKVIFNPS